MWKSALVGLLLGGVKHLALQERAAQAQVDLRGDEELLDLGGVLCLLRPEVASWLKCSGLGLEIARGIQVASALDMGGFIERSSAWQVLPKKRRR